MNLLRMCLVIPLLLCPPVFCKNKNCDHKARGLADSMGKFLHCSMNSAVPVHVCLNCHKRFDDMAKNYTSFMAKCKKPYTQVDRLNVVQSTYLNVVSIWEKGFCPECFSNGNLLESIEKILNEAANLHNCMKDNNKTFCELCSGNYEILNINYNSFVQKHRDAICFDVRDEMNRTRSEWQEVCPPKTASLTVFSSIAPLVLLLPIIFYGSSLGAYRRRQNHSILIEEGNEQNNEVETTDTWAVESSQFNLTGNYDTDLIDELVAREQPGPSSAIESNVVDINDLNLKRGNQDSNDDDDSLLQL